MKMRKIAEDFSCAFCYADNIRKREEPRRTKPVGFFDGRKEIVERTRTPQRMEVWYANLPLNKDSCVQGGIRPVVIISNDICNEVSSVITVAPMTRQMKKLNLPTHAVVDTLDGGRSVVLAEQIMAIDKNRLDNCMGRIRDKDLEKVEAAILQQLGMSRKEQQ